MRWTAVRALVSLTALPSSSHVTLIICVAI
jgi:hypothetical protein